ncbi:MAG: type II secretion system F family protein [Armatimonadetes bacterium]|nr:type II secretion system F family protein [Armatimonadota bacterium]
MLREYQFKAKNPRGRVLHGVLAAENAEGARVDLAARGYEILGLKEQTGWLERVNRLVHRILPVSLFDLAVATRQLAIMLDAGLTMRRTLQVLINQSVSPKLQALWREVERDVANGQPLSRAMARNPAAFGLLYVGMVRAGETSGQLSLVFHQLADHLEGELTMVRKVKAALTYPAMVFLVSAGLALFIVQHILPQFLNGMFREMGQELPWITRSLVVVTSFFNNPIIFGTTLFLVAVAGFLLYHYLKSPMGRRRWQAFALQAPMLGDLQRKVLTARFSRTLGTLIRSGVPVLHSLALCQTVLENYVLAEALERAQQDLKDGARLSQAIAAIPFFPRMLATFIELGEQTGTLSDTLESLARTYEMELDVALETFTAMLEPLMVGVMGGFVAYVLIAVFIPIYKLVTAF